VLGAERGALSRRRSIGSKPRPRGSSASGVAPVERSIAIFAPHRAVGMSAASAPPSSSKRGTKQKKVRNYDLRFYNCGQRFGFFVCLKLYD
jgi:hypothetical protein